MSNVNDNNLDDLLRRAAEKYPLRTDSADFSKVVADLEKDPSLILPPLNTGDRRRRRRFFWLFLLLPLAGGAYFAWHAGTRSTAPVQAVTQTKGAGNGAPVAAGGDGGEMVEAAGGDKKEVVGTAGGEGVKGGDVKDVARAAGGEGVSGGQRKEVVAAANGDRKEMAGATGKNEVSKHNRSVSARQTDLADATVTGRRGKKGNDAGAVRRNNGGVDRGNRTDVIPGNDGGVTNRDRSGVGGRVALASTRQGVGVNIPVTAKADQPVKKDGSAKEGASAKNDPSKKDKQKPKHSFYVGIIGSPDLSLVKFQSVKNVGDNFGVLFGYTLNDHWSIETGLTYDRKKYYTNGEYFSKSKLPPPMSDIDLKKVQGGCNMWEIPVNVRYNFHPANGKMQWFATAGLSTYLMANERYAFWGTYWGNPNWHRDYTYDTPYKYWFSILNLSAGFEQPLGKIGNLRLEPFVRIPLSGVGTGSLSIMSAGLNIGITRKIW